ncbi:MAG: TetR/AcrR family transcriptional regulator [Pseudomonadota bacterium]
MSRKESDTKKRILEATWKLLEKGDAERVRMSDIAKEAGLSRQAVYLHFPKRVELLIATTRYLDDVKAVDRRLAASRAASSGLERLDAFVAAWGGYIPEIYGVAKALIAMKDTDTEADLAWRDRMQAVREGCEAAVRALNADGALGQDFSQEEATDLLWTLLSVRNWEHLRHDCGWSQARYIDHMQRSARRVLT